MGKCWAIGLMVFNQNSLDSRKNLERPENRAHARWKVLSDWPLHQKNIDNGTNLAKNPYAPFRVKRMAECWVHRGTILKGGTG